MSYDYEDIDVVINCRLFYSSAGFRTSANPDHDDCDLLVVLRGDPEARHHGFSGEVHVYDYEKGRVIDWRQRFPAARAITLISLIAPEANEGLPLIRSYVPVMPRFWQSGARSARRRSDGVLHIANYKFVLDDLFHHQLMALIREGLIEVHGNNWQAIGIQTRPLSYRAANRLLARGRCCIGLMYPNQRGRTLSGRMWQAPIHGCAVISEAGTNPFAIPGVHELRTYGRRELEALPLQSPEALRRQATDFWQESSRRLAAGLGLPHGQPDPLAVLACRRTLWSQHLRRRLEDLRGRLPGPRRLLLGLRRRWRSAVSRADPARRSEPRE